MACDSSLVFDVTLNVCQVTTPDCHETSATTQDSDAARPCEKMSGMYYPHPAACNLYIQCSNNITNVRICPDTLYSTLTPQPVSHSHQTLCVLSVPVHCTPWYLFHPYFSFGFFPGFFWLLRVRSVLHFTIFFAMIQSSLWLQRSVSV
ncbi:uncharacterized protein LOC112555898 [Pomacea canaliculata]|uniref:uncharacterized protein LOC112555898 n=1 Tax=Pomacea canaliculata TaxID=400727 RepID=UPI000D7280FA|nr:uncharacterized protein LOC112555898 [Pomacea canaliculata]